MQDPTNSLADIVHMFWTAAITVAGAVVAFFTKRLVDEVDKKADQATVDEIKKDIDALFARQDKQHESNTLRLDQIIIRLGGGRDDR